MVTCPWCIEPMNEEATVCPHCGAVKERKGWKSAHQIAHNGRMAVLGWLIVFVLVFSVGGCTVGVLVSVPT